MKVERTEVVLYLVCDGPDCRKEVRLDATDAAADAWWQLRHPASGVDAAYCGIECLAEAAIARLPSTPASPAAISPAAPTPAPTPTPPARVPSSARSRHRYRSIERVLPQLRRLLNDNGGVVARSVLTKTCNMRAEDAVALLERHAQEFRVAVDPDDPRGRRQVIVHRPPPMRVTVDTRTLAVVAAERGQNGGASAGAGK